MRLIRQAAVRHLIPLVTMSAIAWFIPDPQQARSTFLVGLIVAAVAAATVIYDLNMWTLARRTALHTAVMAVTVFAGARHQRVVPARDSRRLGAHGGQFHACGRHPVGRVLRH